MYANAKASVSNSLIFAAINQFPSSSVLTRSENLALSGSKSKVLITLTMENRATSMDVNTGKVTSRAR